MSDHASPVPVGAVAPTAAEAAWRADPRAAWRWVRSSDLALGYAAIVVMLAIWLDLEPTARHSRLVLDVSTNLYNLRHHPIGVLGASAFVVSSLHGLFDLPLLVVVYTVAQRWVGRLATAFVVILGHVGATLFVATLLASGITSGRLSHSVARVSDVGISYGLACVAAFIVMRVPRRWRVVYVVALLGFYAGPLAWNPNFTSVGHTTALVLGFSLAFVVAQATAFAERGQGPVHR